MNVSWLQASERAESHPSHGVYVLIGDEPALSRQFIASLTSSLSTHAGETLDIHRFRFDESGCDDALFACQSMSLFGGAPIVILEQCTAFLANGKSKWDTAGLEAYLADPVPERTLIITVHGDKLDERKKLSKLLKDHTVVQCHVSKPEDALKILMGFTKKNQIRCASDALQEIWRRTSNVSMAEQEIFKLSTYVNGKDITQRDVEALVTVPVEDNVFHWIDNVTKGNLRQAFRVLDEVERAGYDPLALLALMARQLRMMGYALWLGGQGVPVAQIASRCGAHPYAMRVAADQARQVGLTLRQAEQLLALISDAEYDIKSGRRDSNQALEWIVMACAPRRSRLARAR